MSHLEYSIGLNLAEVEEHVNLMVRSVRARGSLVEVDIRVGGVTLTARAPAGSGELSSVREGEELFVKLP
ncbi:MAG: hypothetical protein DRO01_05540 [Thermoproteota archaeon]|nr:MAG: hypothetical protein DRO01_05540 [Candidatus Korarchaeota archaeon]